MDTLFIEESMLCFQSFLDKETLSLDVSLPVNTSNTPRKDVDVYMDDFFGEFDPKDNGEEDNFSWLFKILPPENQEVPQSDTIRLEYQQNIVPETSEIKTQREESVSQSQSTIIDPLLSEMCVIPLLAETYTETDITENLTTIHDSLSFYEEKENLKNHKELSTIHTDKPGESRLTKVVTTRRNPNILKVQNEIVETPLSTRQKRRKRSYAEMLVVETERFLGAEGTNGTNKRTKMERVGNVSSANSVGATPSLPDKDTNSQRSDDVDDADAPKKSDDLKITFRKSKPVNPLGSQLYKKKLMQKKQLDSYDPLISELYFSHGITPQAFPIPNFGGDTESIIANKLLDVRDVRVQICLARIESHNEKAINSAHGNDKVRKNYSRPHITGVEKQRKNQLVKLYLDDQYETLMASQKACVLSMKSKQPKEELQENGDNPESSFMNGFQFDGYFEDMEKQRTKGSNKNTIKSNRNRLTGAVQIKPQMLQNKQFFAKQAIFNYEGNLYRPNPVVVTLTRIPDETLELMQMPSRHPSLTSPYYAALTSYFDKKETKQ